jgi:hypothetical protein
VVVLRAGSLAPLDRTRGLRADRFKTKGRSEYRAEVVEWRKNGNPSVWQEYLLVLAFFPGSRARGLRLGTFLKKLHQAINQSSATTDDVQTALVLMFFQNFV